MSGTGGPRWWAAVVLMSCVEQYFCSRSAASLDSSTVLLFRALIMLHLVGSGE